MTEKLRVPSIVWQKWRDPLSDSDATYLSPDDLLDEPSFIDDINGQTDDVNDHEQSEIEPELLAKKQIKAIITPFGIMPFDEINSIGHSFNFWVGHTNFDISTKIVSIIEHSDGVETLDVYSRYRFRIGIGQLFNSADVMSGITNHIYKYLDING